MIYSYPYGMYRPYYSYYNRRPVKPLTPTEEPIIEKKQEEKKSENKVEEKPVFEFLGIRFFSDDLLILAILFFLYSEGIKDPELFIALMLLLIS